MTNTQLRIISALVLLAILVVAISLGQEYILGLMFIMGIIIVDEIHTNFFKRERATVSYFLSHIGFALPYIYLNFIDYAPALIDVCINAGILLNIMILFYLFRAEMKSKTLDLVQERFPFFIAVFILLPMVSLAAIFHYDKWIALIVVLVVVNFGMDTGAWFFGKRFGKTKLWPKVSPNKTVEGLVGGVITSGILGTIAWNIAFNKFVPSLIILFGFFGLLSQLGDLFQSKLKRQVDIKDSSALIPGHGGVYDRLDSLLFLSPFFSAAVKYLYFQ